MFNLLQMLLLLLVFLPSISSATSFTGRVVKVSEGDTIQVMNNNVVEKVMLADIDCPEKGQAFGRQAKEFTAAMVAGKVVTVQVRTKDRYGRTVGQVFLRDGANLNKALIAAGYAWYYKKHPVDIALANLEAQAKKARRGLWKEPRPVPPWEWRRSE